MRKRRQWIENLAGWSIVVLVAVIDLPVAIYVRENASQWEALAVFVTLGLGLAPAIWYFRTKRYGWATTIISGILLGFSFMSALLLGWKAQAYALVDIAVIAAFVIISIQLHRSTQIIESVMREMGEELNRDVLLRGDILFRDDGARITVYPSRRRLLLQCISQALFLAIIGGVLAYVRIDNIVVVYAVRLLVTLIVLTFLHYVCRLLIHRPTLVVGPDGIVDHGSLVATGVGLLRWQEILNVAPYTLSSGLVKQRFLNIVLADARAVRKRQPFFMRFVNPMRFVNSPIASSSLGILIWQGLLDVPVNQLAEQIDHYAETHAPAEWLRVWDVNDSEDDADEDSIAQPEQ